MSRLTSINGPDAYYVLDLIPRILCGCCDDESRHESLALNPKCPKLQAYYGSRDNLEMYLRVLLSLAFMVAVGMWWFG